MSENIIHNHAILLKDKVRMEAYKKAIEATVKPGDVVLDIGCGLGILSFLAINAGAKLVHAIDVEPQTLALAKLNAKANGLDKKIIFHKGLSKKLKLKEKVDVIVSELFGNLGLNENCLPVLIDARERLLKKGGKIVPQGCKIYFAPCEQKDWQYTEKHIKNVYGFTCLPDLEGVDLGFPSVLIKNDELLDEPVLYKSIDFTHEKKAIVSNNMVMRIRRDGELNGFAGWFEASLTEKITFSTSPSALITHWKQGFLPLRTPEKVKEGQTLKLYLEMSPDSSGLNSVIGYGYDIS